VLQLRNLGPADDEFFAAVSFTCDAIRGRIGYLQQTVEIDPAFSRAWAMQSQSYSASYAHCSGFADADRAGAKNALMRAEQLAPDTWEVLVAKAQYLTQVERDYARALEPLERAGEQIETPEVWFAKARIYRRQGRWREALAAFERAAVLNPTNDDHRLSSVHMWLRNHDEAITHYDGDIATAPRVRGRVVAYADNYYLKKAWVYWLWKGTTPEARAVLEELPSTEPSMMIQWGWFWQRIYEGRFQEAIDGLEILLGIRAAKITAPEPPALRRPRRPAGP
jgi:tetratricopeptide (TPR) repeat protein